MLTRLILVDNSHSVVLNHVFRFFVATNLANFAKFSWELSSALSSEFSPQRAWVGFKCEDGCLLERSAVEHCHQLVFRQDANNLVVFYQYQIKAVLIESKHTRQELHQTSDLHVAFYRKFEQDIALARVEGNPKEPLFDELDLRDRQGDVHIGFKSD